jgi:hypothetical protein
VTVIRCANQELRMYAIKESLFHCGEEIRTLKASDEVENRLRNLIR